MITTKINPVKGLRLLRAASFMEVLSSFLFIAGAIALLVSESIGVPEGSELLPKGMMSALDTAGIGGMVALGSAIFVLLSAVLELIALIKISSAHVAYRVALVSFVGGLLMSMLTSFLPSDQLIGRVVNFAPIIANLAVVCFVIHATIALLGEIGNDVLMDTGLRVRNIYVICTSILMVSDLVTLAPSLASMFNLITMAVSVVQLVALLKYIGFLKRATLALAR